MKKTGAIFVALIFLLFIGGSALSAEKQFKGVSLKIACVQWGTFLKSLEYAKKVGEEMGMDVSVQWYPWDALRQKLLLDNRVESSVWDLVYVDYKWVGEFAKFGLVEPLEKYMDDPKIVDKALMNPNDWLPSSAPTTTYEDKLIAMPTGSSFISLAYRTDIFSHPDEKKRFQQKYGYELQAPQTYQQFLDIARFFTRKKGESLMGKPLDEDFFGTSHSNKKGGFLWHDYISYLVSSGADIIYDPKSMQPTWNSPENIAVGKLYAEVAKTCPPGHNVMTSGESTSWFANGKVAMILEWSDRIINICENPKSSKIIGKFDYGLNPSWEGWQSFRPHATMDGTSPLGIWSHSKNKLAAYKLLEKMVSRDIQLSLILDKEYPYPSLLKSLYDEPIVKQRYRYPSLIRQILETDVHVYMHPLIPEYPQASNIASLSVSEVLTGMKTVHESYNDAQARLVELFKKAGYIE
jgi:multiple sugar transport system substrate-binding protein